MESITLMTARIDEIRSLVGLSRPAGTFQTALDAQMTASTIAPVAAAERGPDLRAVAGSVMGSGDLDGYLAANRIEERNGRLDPSELEPISGGWGDRNFSLIGPAADAFEMMRAAAGREGIDLRVIDGYRSWEVQARAYEDYLAGRKGGPVAPPGTSQHGNGLAVDFTNGSVIGSDDPEWSWLRRNAGRYGFVQLPSETWHWDFKGV
jgi:hypothetical protein